ncbi:MAG TPA: short chain dehydrogenase [Hyphomonas sp.]|uniref:SDR family oxidoreductase n=1 Tax=Hyphomonas sp. UBA5107 TaxID=1946636 RepID=UPI000C5C7D3C|nr:SDR family oxidoreductase [Hyphomonas sp. UBA5107]MAN65700.1 short-chain dehydrogenase [Hyphomonadaceae bacterium]HBL92390.1 short chain dehydrogenase [Hyphomonas sp.]HCJ17972.1 short chain dehydrogenase [Hyphomonas sp.]HCN93708.1 short chain dehydrogenase [Hyphomonas sp.]
MSFSLDQFRLDGQVAIVTGAGGRGNSIGRAYALGLSRAGAKVVVADLNEDGANRVANEIRSAGREALAVRVDITDRPSVDAMVAETKASFGGVDILVNNAALMVEIVSTPAMQIDLESWNKAIAVNLTGALNCSQAVAPLMSERGGGRIVNQVSGGAFPAQTVYGVTKIALVGLTTTLSRELGAQNITVNAIAPGNTMSDAGAALTPDDAPFVKMLEGMVTLRLRGEPDELVGALLLLVSPAGSWISGQVLHVDGGWILRP